MKKFDLHTAVRCAVVAAAMFCSILSVADTRALAGPPESPAAGAALAADTAPVRIDGAVLFPVRGVAAHPARERAAVIVERITAVAEDGTVGAGSIVLVESDNSTDILAGDRFIMSVFDADAAPDGVPREVLAKLYAAKIRTAIETYRENRGARSIRRAVIAAFGAMLGLVALLLLIRLFFRKLITMLERRFTARIRELQARSHDIIRTEWIWMSLRSGLRTVKIVMVLLLVLFFIDLILTLFPWTRAYAVPLHELVLTPFRSIGVAVLAYLPKLVFLIVLFLVARFALKLIRVFFLGIEQHRITFTGFEAEWAIPAYKVARLAVIAFTVVVAYPYIPGSDSPAFKGVSLFLGVVFSLGSSASISNFIAGYMVIFRRAFKAGDRVRIGSLTGDVIQIRLQVTHLRTIKNEEAIVPNSLIVNSEVVNYSSLARKTGLILHTTVTIGYDTPWRQVHALLLLAAERTPGLLKEPKPFVLQTALNDFYVSYELNGYTDRPAEMAATYSDLHRNIQDAFNEQGVQIMSPHYLGDPPESKIVPKDQWYRPPAGRDGGEKPGSAS
jgi:small-conductance mechanosensitive channel